MTVFAKAACLLAILSSAAAFLPPFHQYAASRRQAAIISDIPPPESFGKLNVDASDAAKVWEVKLTLDGQTKVLQVSEETNLLEAAEEAFPGEVQSSCCAGVCNSCAAKFTGPKTSFEDEVATLSEEDVARGYMLICSSYPKGPGLEITLNQQAELLEI